MQGGHGQKERLEPQRTVVQEKAQADDWEQTVERVASSMASAAIVRPGAVPAATVRPGAVPYVFQVVIAMTGAA